MINLLYIPYQYSILSDDIEYITKSNLNILPATLMAIEKGFNTYHIYKGNERIGVLVGKQFGNTWYAHRILLYTGKIIYFKRVLDSVSRLAKSFGCIAITLSPNTHTKKIYDKYSIAKELKWD